MKVQDGYNSPNFCSLRAQKILGEEVVRTIRSDLGPVKSSSSLVLRVDNLACQNFIFRRLSLKDKLEKIGERWKLEIEDKFLTKDISQTKFENLEEFVDKLKQNIKDKGNKANCWEYMALTFNELKKRGENPRSLELYFYYNNMYIGNHFTTIIGLKKNADVVRPKTWGSKAMIIDPFFGIVDSADRGMEKLINFNRRGLRVSRIEHSMNRLGNIVHFKSPPEEVLSSLSALHKIKQYYYDALVRIGLK